jgi:hypothetical protein
MELGGEREVPEPDLRQSKITMKALRALLPLRLICRSPAPQAHLLFRATRGFNQPQGYSLVDNAILLARFGCQAEARFDSFVITCNSRRDIFSHDGPVFESVA